MKNRTKLFKEIPLEEIRVLPDALTRQCLIKLVETKGIEAAKPQLQELMESMKTAGQIECIGVSEIHVSAELLREDGLTGVYQLIFGLRRFLAARLLGWETIKAVVL